MPRFRSRNNLRPINSRKHVVDIQGGTVAGTKVGNDLALAVESTTLANVTEVEIGSTVKSIFLNVQVSAIGTAALANIYMYVMKNPSSAIAFATFPNGNAVGASNVKKLIFHQEMTMTEKNTTAIPRTLFKGVLKIPRHMQRMGPADEIRIVMFSPGVDFEFCIQCIYKDYA